MLIFDESAILKFFILHFVAVHIFYNISEIAKSTEKK